MKNVAVIVHSLNSGGAERIAGLLSKELSKNYNVYLFLMETDNIIYEYGGVIVDIGKSGVFYEFAIKTYKEKYEIDCAISFLETMNFANIRTKGNEKVIISERCVQSLAEPELAGETYRIKRYYNAADGIVSCAYGVKYDLVNCYHVKSPIHIIYNFINKENIYKKSEEALPIEVTDFLNGSQYFVNVGRLHPQKNQERLIKQFAYFLNRNGRDCKLVILGNGKLKEQLNSLIDYLQLQDSVKIFPYVNNPFSIIKNAKALILSSHYEGLPNVILEAFCLQCPVIATDCLSGPRELLTDIKDYSFSITDVKKCDRGILVPDVDTDDDGTTTFISDAMDVIKYNPEYVREIIDNITAYMRGYSNEDIVKQWERIIEECPNREIRVLDSEADMLNKAEKIVIYGAGYVGRTLYFRLSKQYKICAFVVTKKKKEEETLFGLPIKDISEFYEGEKKPTVIIGISDNYQNEVLNNLEKRGFDKLVYPFVEPYTYDFYANNDHWNLTSEISEWRQVHETNQELIEMMPSDCTEKAQWLKNIEAIIEYKGKRKE